MKPATVSPEPFGKPVLSYAEGLRTGLAKAKSPLMFRSLDQPTTRREPTLTVLCAKSEMTPAANERNLLQQAGWGGLTP